MVLDVVTNWYVKLVSAGLTLILVAAIAVAGIAGEKPKKVVPPTQIEVATTWIGLSEDGHYMLRLLLHRDGTGDGAYVFLDNNPTVFHLRWEYQKGQIVVTVKEPDAAPDVAGGFVGGVAGVMRIETKGTDWRISFSLRKESEIEARWRRLVEVQTSQP